MKNFVLLPVLFAGAYITGAFTSINSSSESSFSKQPVTYHMQVTSASLDNLSENPIINNADTSLKNVADTAAANFVSLAAIGGKKEVEMGKLAQQKATNARVKAYGAMMVADHTKSNSELMQLAKAKKMVLPTNAMHEEHNFMAKAKEIFDQEYMTMMIKDHQKTISLFQRASSNVKDPSLKAFATKTLPVLQRHLDSAKAIYGSLKPWNQ